MAWKDFLRRARPLVEKPMLAWRMAPGEQSAMLFILERLRPKLSIEIGTFPSLRLRDASGGDPTPRTKDRNYPFA
jgi:hypothetical protein